MTLDFECTGGVLHISSSRPDSAIFTTYTGRKLTLVTGECSDCVLDRQKCDAPCADGFCWKDYDERRGRKPKGNAG